MSAKIFLNLSLHVRLSQCAWCITGVYVCVCVKGDADQERIKRQQELNALSIYQLQQMHQYQYILR